MRFNFRASILRSTALVALTTFGVVGSPSAFGQAQSGGDQTTSGGQPIEEVVVTGTAIVRDGYSAPTPLTVVNPEQLETSSTGNIADYVNTIPAFFGSATPDTAAHSSSSAQAGLNVVNLRDLGGIRTLVLIDGQRSVGSTTTGLVDINNIPQDLVTRVDIVTGGASAVYGSDAVAGVVNFVLNKTFEGTKADLSGGVTTYGDDWNWRLRLTEGLGFDGDRIHLIVSGEIFDDTGVKGVPRAWNNTGAEIINNPAYKAGNGLPQLLTVNHAAVYTAASGGMIDSGPAAQTTFSPNGQPVAFNLGSIVSNPYTVGGDWASNQANYTSLDPEQDAQRIFTRASYALTDDITVFGQYSYSAFHSFGVNEPVFYLGNLTLQSNNAYLPASIASKYTAAGISSFTFGSLNGGLPPWSDNTYRTTARYVTGADGKFDALGSNWTWSGYFQEGDTYSEFNAEGVPLVANYMKAIQAVVNPANGQIVCASTLTNPTNGCVPLDLFGTGGASPAAINYVEGQGTTPTQHLHLQEDVWSGQITGEPFSDWAGPVSIAAGAQHRREYLHTTTDQFGPSGGWYGANYIPVTGVYSVTEGFIETVVPLAKDEFWAKELDLNAAVRATDYSTSGYVTTFKVGATWDVTPDLRIRATRSRDIRAPNLSELFQAGAGGTQSLIDDFHGRDMVLNTGLAEGNINLKPETADNTGVGAVVQPRFLPGFSASVDYWQINISNAITSLTGQNTIDLCFEGIQLYCSRITPDLATLPVTPISGVQIVTEPTNFAAQIEEGLDFEASYHFDLADVVSDWNGGMNFRYLGTHYITNVTSNNGLTPSVQIVGSTIPRWRHNLIATYSGDPWTISVIGRLTSAGVLNANYAQCSTGCPLSTTNNPTINNNYEPGSFYLDTAINYNVGSGFQVYLNIANIFNTNPAIIPQGPSGIPYENIQTNTSLYDILGRTFRLGVRLGM
jgi:iron complex outermembrane recepter protein